jgi:hypothetical protein
VLNLSQTGSDQSYELIVKSGKYDGNNNYIDFQSSASLSIEGATSSSYNLKLGTTILLLLGMNYMVILGGASSSNVLAPDGVIFDGQFQEFRYWNTNLSQSTFNQHVLEPYIIY